MFDEPGEWPPPHIGLAQWADAFVVAPCTANVIAKIACGIADDTLSAAALAFGQGPRLVIAPAMNDAMLANPATQANLATLASRGVTVVEAAEGDLACGSSGRGRLADLADIVAAVRASLA
jgi:phosphopantothenoylcysteine decarboxylase/phosphopantothenate--cysteine ligase